MPRRTLLLATATPLAFACVDGAHLAALPEAPGPRGPRTVEQAAIESQPVCIASSVASAGELADVLYYRAAATSDGRVKVGYFAFFSEERPWGNNWLTWSVLPSLAVDMVYSRALFVAPGLQRALYGPGDVEGVAVVYDVAPDGTLRLDYAVADDRDEQPTTLLRGDAYALDPARPTFTTDIWSHQLGYKARAGEHLAYRRCYEGDSIRPLPDGLARDFRVDENRAGPAHVEREGRPIESPLARSGDAEGLEAREERPARDSE
jgi:hypothetical protein